MSRFQVVYVKTVRGFVDVEDAEAAGAKVEKDEGAEEETTLNLVIKSVSGPLSEPEEP